MTLGLRVTLEAKPGKEDEIAKALGQVADDLLTSPPDIRPIDILAAKTAG